MTRPAAKKLPFLYRSIFHFWFVFVLPTSLAMMAVTHLYLDGSLQLQLLGNIRPWINCLLFQIIFGFLAYIWIYVPAVKKFKKGY
jgi:hypothetical protein